MPIHHENNNIKFYKTQVVIKEHPIVLLVVQKDIFWIVYF